MVQNQHKDTTIHNIYSFESTFSTSLSADNETQKVPKPTLHKPGNDAARYDALEEPYPDSFNCPGSEGELALSGLGRPVWKKNDSKIYVVAYPSDPTSTYFQVDHHTRKVYSLGAGYGIFVEPKKVSKAKFWKDKGGEPTLFTVEGGGPAPGLTARCGAQWGINGMLARFVIDSKDEVRGFDEVRTVLEQAAWNVKAGDERWLRDALIALVQAGLVKNFYIQDFIDVAKVVVKEQLPKGARRDYVLTVDYEDYIKRGSHAGQQV